MLLSWLTAVPLEFLVAILIFVLILFAAVLMDELRSKIFRKRYDAMMNKEIDRMARVGRS